MSNQYIPGFGDWYKQMAESATIEIKPGSTQSFGVVFTAVFLLIALHPLLRNGDIRWWSLAISVLILLVTVVSPTLLIKPNYWWFRFGLFLGGIVAPVVMAIVYVSTIVPIGFAMRMCGKDILRLKGDRTTESYWIQRHTPLQSMKNQF